MDRNIAGPAKTSEELYELQNIVDSEKFKPLKKFIEAQLHEATKALKWAGNHRDTDCLIKGKIQVLEDLLNLSKNLHKQIHSGG